MERLPEVIHEKIFAKVMDTAELAILDKRDGKAYGESLKNYRYLKNALDSSEGEGEKNAILKFYNLELPLK